MPTAADFRTELAVLFAEGKRLGRPYVEVRAGDLHGKAQRRSPTNTPRIPNCCSVMRQEQKQGDAVVSPKASDSMEFTIRYLLPRTAPYILPRGVSDS